MQNKDLKKIENQGWKEMQQILDQELPVEKSKKRFAPWFWLTGMAAISVLVAVLFFMNNAPNHQDAKPIVSDKITNVATDSNTKTNKKENFETSTKKEISNEEITTKEVKISNERTAVKKESISNIEIVNPTIITTDIVKPTTILKPTSTNTMDQKVINQYEHFISETMSLTCNEPTVSPVTKTAKHVEQLSINLADLDYDYLKKPPVEPILLKSIKPLKERKLKAQWAMNVGVLSTNQPRIHGGSVGGQVQFPVSKKWALKTGLTYRTFKVDEILVNESTARSLTLNNRDSIAGTGSDPSGNSILLANIGEATYNTQTKKFEFKFTNWYHFLAIPIEAHFQINKSNNLWIGTEASYLLNADQQNSAADLLNWGTQSNDPGFSYTTDFAPSIPRIDLGVSVGYQYQISQKLGVNLSYHHGNLIQQKEWHLNNKFFKLGANYKL